ncbi:MAG: N-acetylneuraminate synthase family protein [Treponema sp.]|nr:N-acetylneuraminate synthase family protein [Treponema sp.]
MVIAEIGTSHEGSIEKAKKLVDAASESGTDYIKFQWVYASEILHPKTGFVDLPTGKIPLYDRFKELECPPSFYKELLDYTHSKGKKFICSPFGLKSLEELLSIQPDAIKIASPELNHYKMLEALRDYRASQKEKLPVILSSGVSKMQDIEKALKITGTENVSLLHCITSYPAPEEEYNLKLITKYKKEFKIECGVSDHSLDPVLVPALSIACGGTIIEKHITLSRKTSGLDDPVALEPEQFGFMCHAVNQSLASINHYGADLGSKRIIEQISEQYGEERVKKVLGSGIKELAPSEKENYGRTNRSLHYMNDLKKGDVIKEGDIAILRTEKILTPGISPEYYDTLIGKTLTCDVSSGSGVMLSHF